MDPYWKRTIGGIILVALALTGVFLAAWKIKKEITAPILETNPPQARTEPETAVDSPKNIYYMTATVVEKKEKELAVSGMIPETAFSGRAEPRLVIADEKTQVVKILADDYQTADWGDIETGDKIVVSTYDNFKNKEAVSALTISLYPAGK